MSTIIERYQHVLHGLEAACVSAGRAPGSVTLIAVSKLQPASAIEELYHAGHRDFGENYVQEMVEKAQALSAKGLKDIRWHFIGHLQSNKVRLLCPWVHAVHSVDSLKLAQELSKRWAGSGRAGEIGVFLEVNLHGEASKAGVPAAQVRELAAQVASFPELRVLGLMCIPDPGEDAARAFAQLRELEASCRPHSAGQLSMGMTQDFEQAIAAGSTHVRVGTAIFGERRAS